MSTFSDNLTRYREQANMSRKELAAILGVSVASIGFYETGRNEPDLQKLVTIAAALHVSVDDLLGYHVDDFDKAAALFREATGKTATRNGDPRHRIRTGRRTGRKMYLSSRGTTPLSTSASISHKGPPPASKTSPGQTDMGGYVRQNPAARIVAAIPPGHPAPCVRITNATARHPLASSRACG